MLSLLLRLCQTEILGIKKPKKKGYLGLNILHSFKGTEEKIAFDFSIIITVTTVDGVFTY
jgi:hypothetical protein